MKGNLRPSSHLHPILDATVSDMEYFIAQAKIILPVLGVNIFRAPAAVGDIGEAAPAPHPASSPVFELRVKKYAIIATAKEIDGEFTVLEGSRARPAWTGIDHAYKVLHSKLVRDGALIPDGDGQAMRFARNQVFASPSAAAAVVVGRTANGRHDWKIKGTGMSFGDWQAQGIEQPARDGSS